MSWFAALQGVDVRVLEAAHGAPSSLVPLFLAATIVGGGWGLLAIVPFLLRAATRVTAAWLLGAIVAQSAIVAALKAIVGRVRPCDALAWCSPLGVASPGGGSFPSGHAAGAFAFAAFVATIAPRWTVPALAFAALTAWSRCVLGVHYPSDVIAGAMLGAAVGAAFGREARRRAHRAPEASSGATT